MSAVSGLIRPAGLRGKTSTNPLHYGAFPGTRMQKRSYRRAGGRPLHDKSSPKARVRWFDHSPSMTNTGPCTVGRL